MKQACLLVEPTGHLLKFVNAKLLLCVALVVAAAKPDAYTAVPLYYELRNTMS